jgi:hypothetical protein
MIEILTRWWFARKVCRKYNLRFVPLWSKAFKGDASYYHYSGEFFRVRVSLFNEYFYEIFFHEIGHVVYKKTSQPFSLKTFSGKGITRIKGNFREVPYFLYLIEEATASRYALRALKKLGKCRQDSCTVLCKAVSTYTAQVLVNLSYALNNKINLADTDYSLIKYIRN